RSVVRIALSKMRGFRVMNCRIHSRRWAFINTVTEGWSLGGCSVAQPMENQARNSQPRAARSARDRGPSKVVSGSMARFYLLDLMLPADASASIGNLVILVWE